jgi:hypothetical protein
VDFYNRQIPPNKHGGATGNDEQVVSVGVMKLLHFLTVKWKRIF